MEFVAEHEAPPSYHLVSLMTMFSALLERRLVINRGYTIRGNVYSLLLGPPAMRKTYTTRITRQLFADAGFPIETCGENTTDEGLLREMQRKEQAGESPHAVIVAEEFGTLLGKKKYQEGLVQWLCRAYDGEKLQNLRKGDSYGVSDSFLTILAGTTPRSLRGLSAMVVDSGLASRLWIVREMRKEKWNSRPRWNAELKRALVVEMKERFRELMQHADIVFDPGPVTEQVFDEWYMGKHRRFVESAPEELDAWAGRRHDHAMRAGVLLHLLDTGDLEGMGEAAIRRGIEFIELMEPGMAAAYGLLGLSDWGELWAKIEGMIRNKPGVEARHVLAGAGRWASRGGEAQKVLEDMLKAEVLRHEGEGGTMKLWVAEGDRT